MPQPTVLISGAGIGGPTLAYWLAENGYRVVVVELADGIRPGGQTVDLRGAGRAVVERMGLMGEMGKRALDQKGRRMGPGRRQPPRRDAGHGVPRQRDGVAAGDPSR